MFGGPRSDKDFRNTPLARATGFYGYAKRSKDYRAMKRRAFKFLSTPQHEAPPSFWDRNKVNAP